MLATVPSSQPHPGEISPKSFELTKKLQLSCLKSLIAFIARASASIVQFAAFLQFVATGAVCPEKGAYCARLLLGIVDSIIDMGQKLLDQSAGCAGMQMKFSKKGFNKPDPGAVVAMVAKAKLGCMSKAVATFVKPVVALSYRGLATAHSCYNKEIILKNSTWLVEPCAAVVVKASFGLGGPIFGFKKAVSAIGKCVPEKRKPGAADECSGKVTTLLGSLESSVGLAATILKVISTCGVGDLYSEDTICNAAWTGAVATSTGLVKDLVGWIGSDCTKILGWVDTKLH